MMEKIICISAIILALFSPLGFASDENGDIWKYEKEILTESELEYKEIILDKEVYRYSNPDLSDIRIVDGADNFLPYYIVGQYENIEASNQYIYYTEKILEFGKNSDLFFDFKLISESTEKDFIVNQIDLDIDLSYNFAKEIITYGSYDNEKWDLIKRDDIYNIGEENNSKTSIYFDGDLKYNYYRLSILKNIEDLKIDSIRAIRNEEPLVNINDYIVEEELEYQIDEKNSETVLSISNPDKLKIFKIQVFTDDIFNREYSLLSQSAYLYNMGTINSEQGGNIINIYEDYNREDAENLNLVIYNRDDKPINIDRILVSYYIDRLVFKSQGKDEYRILLGNEDARAPYYDIISYKSDIEAEEKEMVVFGDTEENIIENRVDKEFNMKIILNIVVIATSIFLIFIILKNMSKK